VIFVSKGGQKEHLEKCLSTHRNIDDGPCLARKGEDYITFVDESLYVNFSLTTWWINSGAIVHVCNSLQGFFMKKST
jgi:hypothetical protein